MDILPTRFHIAIERSSRAATLHWKMQTRKVDTFSIFSLSAINIRCNLGDCLLIAPPSEGYTRSSMAAKMHKRRRRYIRPCPLGGAVDLLDGPPFISTAYDSEDWHALTGADLAASPRIKYTTPVTDISQFFFLFINNFLCLNFILVVLFLWNTYPETWWLSLGVDRMGTKAGMMPTFLVSTYFFSSLGY